jgi:hypothetical protein
VLALLLSGCDGLIGGEEAARIPLQAAADGGYAPVRILLKPEMNMVAFNLHADFVWGKREEAGQWNSYRATLSSGGKVIHAQEFQVNSPEKTNAASSSPPTSLQQPVMRVDVPADAEYEIAIASLKPAAVTLTTPQLVVRINVRQL